MMRITTIKHSRARSILLCLLSTLLFSHAVYALEGDKSQPISIQANSVFIDNKAGKSQYEGNVSVQNGSTHLTASKAIVYTTKDNAIREAEAFGDGKTQAHYWTITDPKKPELNAYADIIRIFPDKHLIYLIGNAKVSQGDDFYQAPRIEYNSETQHVFSPRSSQGRTTIVIHPQKTPSTKGL